MRNRLASGSQLACCYQEQVAIRKTFLSGSAGYPDEEDFPYLSIASGLSFEVVQAGMTEPLCYGRSAIGATVQYLKVADGAGHLSDHLQSRTGLL